MQPSCIFAEADQVLQGLIILSSYTDTALELTDLWDIICPSVCSINDSELTQLIWRQETENRCTHTHLVSS